MELIVGSFSGRPVETEGGVRAQSNPWVQGTHPWLAWIENRESDAGILITPESALEHTPLWHGMLLLGGDAGSLHVDLRERVADDRVTLNTTALAYRVMNVAPNEIMAPSTFWEMMVPRAILWGNAVCEIVRNNAGTILPVASGGGLLPLDPRPTRPFFDDMGKLWIETRDQLPRGGYGPKRFLDPQDTFHLPSLSTDGFWGTSLAHKARNRIANGLGMNQQHNRFMDNGMQPDWLFSFPTAINPEDLEDFEEKLNLRNRGIRNTGRSVVVDNGMEARQLGMNFEHAQFVEMSKLDVQMVASLLAIPAAMLNSMDAMTFNNTEESEKWYINRTLRRWLNKIAQEADRKLLTDRERERMSFRHNLDPLLKGKLLERYEAYAKGIQHRFINPNEARAEEGLNPYEGGDEFQNPNTTPGVPEREPEEESVEEEAARLRGVLEREDMEIARACAEKNGDLLMHLEEFYHGRLLNELSTVVPNTAFDYCNARFRLWRNISGHVQSHKSLGEIVKAQKSTTKDRIAGLLTEEFGR